MTEQTALIDVVCRIQITYDASPAFVGARENAISCAVESQCCVNDGVQGFQPATGRYSSVILEAQLLDVTSLVRELRAACAKFAEIDRLAEAALDLDTVGASLALDNILNITDAAQDDLKAVLQRCNK
jgi:hypothetical protein